MIHSLDVPLQYLTTTITTIAYPPHYSPVNQHTMRLIAIHFLPLPPANTTTATVATNDSP